MKVIGITLPESVKLRRKNVSTQIKDLIMSAVYCNVSPKSWKGDEKTKTYSVRFSEVELELLKKEAESHNEKKLSHFLSRMAYAGATSLLKNALDDNKHSKESSRYESRYWMEFSNIEKGKEKSKRGIGIDVFGSRQEQRRFYNNIVNLLSTYDNGIILAEGGTGLGKSRVVVTLAIEKAYEGQKTLIAAPTVQVLSQIVTEFANLMGQESLEGEIPAAVVLGKQHFVSQYKLQQWMETLNNSARKKVEEWVKNGAPVQKSLYGQTFIKIFPELSWLVDDLVKICPEAENETLCLDDYCAEDDAGYLVYQAMKDKTHDDAPIVFCTHAGVVYDMILRRRFEWEKGMFDTSDRLLIIDEAHLFSVAAESAHSMTLSIHMLKVTLRRLANNKIRGASTCEREVAKLMKKLQEIDDEERALIALRDDSKINKIVASIIEKINKILKNNSLPQAHTYFLKDAAIILKKTAIDKTAIAVVRFSPIRRYPSIMAGPKTLHSFYKDFWSHYSQAVLTSGTIFLPAQTSFSGPKSDYIREILRLPIARVKSFPPVHPSWTRNYEAYRPADHELKSFEPPPGDTPADDPKAQKWHETLSMAVGRIAEEATGGTVVLCTSYETIDELGKRLTKVMEDRLVVQTKEKGFYEALNEFTEKYRNSNVKPVWLATGPAWAGLDLSDTDVTPANDFMLTDLVIVRFPFGNERTIIHEYRVENRGFKWEVWRTCFMFRQGVGRLIRRKGVKNRRLWILDARAWTDGRWFFKYMLRTIPVEIRSRVILQ